MRHNVHHAIEEIRSVDERLPPPDVSTLPGDTADLLALASDRHGKTLGTIAVLAHRPALVGPFLTWAAALAGDGALSPRHHELLALRIAHRCNSPFEWSEHVDYALAREITKAEIDRIATDDPADWSPAEAALIRAADELITTSTVRESTWDDLTAHFDEAQLVEVVYVAGQYTMLSMVANALGVPARDRA